MEYYSAVKRDPLLTHATTWIRASTDWQACFQKYQSSEAIKSGWSWMWTESQEVDKLLHFQPFCTCGNLKNHVLFNFLALKGSVSSLCPWTLSQSLVKELEAPLTQVQLGNFESNLEKMEIKYIELQNSVQSQGHSSSKWPGLGGSIPREARQRWLIPGRDKLGASHRRTALRMKPTPRGCVCPLKDAAISLDRAPAWRL